MAVVMVRVAVLVALVLAVVSLAGAAGPATDSHANFGYSTVTVAPVTATAGTAMTVASGVS